MRTIFLFLSLGSMTLLSHAQAFQPQAQPQPLERSTAFMGNVAQDMMYDRTKIYLDDKVYLIEGQSVVGTPFLYRFWCDGYVKTVDGKVFTNYKLKYNVFNQSVFFSNGPDSLEANEPISEFYLLVKEDSLHTNKYTFVNAGNYKKEKTTFYYEVLIDSSRGQLLKLNQKLVGEGHNGLPVFEGKKIFRLDVNYFFYDKQAKKITRLKGNGSNVPAMLGLTNEEKEALDIENVDFNNEAELMMFFNVWFKMKSS